jgi:hypothetical protein
MREKAGLGAVGFLRQTCRSRRIVMRDPRLFLGREFVALGWRRVRDARAS